MKKIAIIKRLTDDNHHESWKLKTPEERLSAVEFLREQCFIFQGYNRLPSIVMEISIRKQS